MLMNVRSAMLSIGRWLLPALVVPSALACSAPADPPVDPARAFVDTPGGRRLSVVASSNAQSAAALSTPDQPFVIAKFNGRISLEARKALASAGFREVGYLPYDALLLERPASAPDRHVPGMVAWFPYLPADRISRELLPESLAERVDQSRVRVMIHVMPGHDRAAARAAVIARGGIIAGEGRAGAFTRISAAFSAATVADDVRLLAEQSEIFFLERIHRIGLLNDKAVGTIQMGAQGHDAAHTPIWEHGIRGENQIVAVLDTGLDANSCYFGDMALPVTNTWSDTGGYGSISDPSHRKIVAYDFLFSCDQYPSGMNCETPTNLAQWDTNNHGTHVSGNMVGDSDSNPEVYASADGHAPAAKVVMQDAGYFVDECGDLPGIGCPVINLEPIFEQSFKQGARVHNNSYGDNENALAPIGSNYSARSQDVDHFMWEHKDFLIVYAAGNNAMLGGGGVKNFSVISPSTNKNGLSVGSARTPNAASTNDDNISTFSSLGWTADGRIKPDLMAPGCNAAAGNDRNVGGTPNCGNNSGCGTSYASPTAVGAAALVRQYFMDGFYPSGAKSAADALTPTAALVKATLLNSTVSMKGTDQGGGTISPIPSNEQGWGRIQLDQALVFSGGTRKLMVDDHRAGLPTDATTPITYTLTNVDASLPLKVTLAWTDFPGMPDSATAAPTLTDPTTWAAAQLVNDLDLTVNGPTDMYLGNVFTDGVSSTGGTADRRNNVEQVLLATPTAGTYTITVTPSSIVHGEQDFAVVITGAWTGTAGGTRDGGGDSGGSAGAGGTGGAGGSGATAGAGGSGATAGAGGTSVDSGCNCNLASRNPSSSGHLLVLALPLLLPVRRRLRKFAGARTV